MKRMLWVILWVSFAFTIDDHPVSIVPGSIRLASPVRNELSISGSFGELRHNHFHHGIDIRSIGPCGDEILSIADGYISKIVIDAEDLGKTLFITHPNGLVSVYAHLNGFRQDLENRIRERQYADKLYQVQLDFTADEIPVQQGELVAYMGNTGASRGKHLHLELRDRNGEEVWDPLLFGFPVEDNKSPSIQRIKVAGYDLEGNEVYHQVYNMRMLGQKNFKLRVPGESFSLSVDANDVTDHSRFRTGIKTISMQVNGEDYYQFVAEKWKRADTKYINAHIDHGGSGRHAKGKFHRCYLLRGNCLGLYNANECRGYIPMKDSSEHQVRLVVADGSGNSDELEFTVEKTGFVSRTSKKTYRDDLFYDREKTFEGSFSKLNFQAGSVYEDLSCQFKETVNDQKNTYSGWAGVLPYHAQLHFPVDIQLKPQKEIPESLKSKCFIAQRLGKTFKNLGGVWDGDWMKTTSRSMGPFTIMVDTVAPTLTWLKPKRKKAVLRDLKFRLHDNYTSAKEIPDLHYEAYIDGLWVIMEYDKKSSLLRYPFESWIGKGKHQYRILVRDQLGNERNYTGEFSL